MKNILTIVVIGVVVLLAGVIFILAQIGIFSSNTKDNGGNTPTENNTDTNTNENTDSTTTSIDINEFTFIPATTTIKKGETVTWTNKESTRHDVKSDLFQSPLLAQGETFSFTYNEVGTFEYICGVHPAMKGTIKVE